MVDVEAIQQEVTRAGWFHGDVGPLDRDELLAIARAFGEPFETEESQGHIVSTYVREASDPNEHIPLEFHNEAVYLRDEPTMVLFYCSSGEAFEGGGTGIVASEAVLDDLTPEERRTAEALSGVIHMSRADQRPYRLIRTHPVTGVPCIHYAARFPRALRKLPVPRILVLESEAQLALLGRIDEVSKARHRFVDWAPGRLLVLDNYRMLHARYPVTAGRLVLWRALCR